MKFYTMLALPFLYVLASLITPEQTNKTFSYPTEGAVSELRDIKGRVFATGLFDYRGFPVDTLRFDAFYPTGASSDKKYPVLLFCHAGGFSGGNRFNVSAICDRFADQGFIAVGFDYRVGYRKGNIRNCEADTTTQNEAIYRASQDANSCMRYLVAHADELNIDTSKIFIGGSSAGAVLALTNAYLNDSVAQIRFPDVYTKLGGVQSTGNNLVASWGYKGIISMWGGLFSDKVIDTNYRAYPTIFFRGSSDDGIPDSMGHYAQCPNFGIIYGATGLYERCRTQNTPSVYYLLDGASHPAYDDIFCVEQSSCFLKAVLDKRGYTGQFSGYVSSCQ